uniref:Uncharacterized protein n=1 Tax=Leptobrachium leishanense TaxID=445787 RepID=A0A8C5MXE1_9ANUR
MGKHKRLTQAPGTPEERHSPPHSGIRGYFPPQSGAQVPQGESKMAAGSAAHEGPKMVAATTPTAPHSPASPGGGWETPPDLLQIMRALPTREDLTAATRELRHSLSGEIQQVRQDVLGLTRRIVAVEGVHQAQADAIQAHSTQLTLHHTLLQTLTRQLEDLENRGRRNNIRIRGLPENERDSDDLHRILTNLFNFLLQKAPDTAVEMERWHRALRSRGPPGSPPRIVICCLLRFSVKEAIMAGARNKSALRFEGAKVELFQDVSLLTLHSRRALKPLTSALQQAGLQYRWIYPAGLQVRTPQGPVTVRGGDELPEFLSTLNLPPDTILEWPDPIRFLTYATQRPQRVPRQRRSPRGAVADGRFAQFDSQEA